MPAPGIGGMAERPQADLGTDRRQNDVPGAYDGIVSVCSICIQIFVCISARRTVSLVKNLDCGVVRRLFICFSFYSLFHLWAHRPVQLCAQLFSLGQWYMNRFWIGDAKDNNFREGCASNTDADSPCTASTRSSLPALGVCTCNSNWTNSGNTHPECAPFGPVVGARIIGNDFLILV